MSRATVLFLAGLALAIGCTPRRASPPFDARPTAADGGAPSVPGLSILASASVHGHAVGLARRATLADRVREESKALLQVDAGDLLSVGVPEEVERQARLLLAAYARMGVDAITVGEG